ncbi:MAG: FadR family transcriptional regulator [Myxococcales bacterium]|nr:FadR family transcriptional regulator [Myxococcales bacterium]
MLAPVSSSTLPATASAVEAVVEALLAEILRGNFPPGTRLPAEREMARLLGASRPTLREALRRLGEWNLVEPRRGSGIVVRPRSEWTIEVLPAFLRYGRPPDGTTTLQLLRDLLTLRRTLLGNIVELIAARMPPGGTAAARAQVERAWAARERPAAFVHEDFLVMRAVVEATGFLPAVWMLNRIAGVYMDIAVVVTVRVPDDYVASAHGYLDALDRGDGAAAAAKITAYLDRHDAAMLGVSP